MLVDVGGLEWWFGIFHFPAFEGKRELADLQSANPNAVSVAPLVHRSERRCSTHVRRIQKIGWTVTQGFKPRPMAQLAVIQQVVPICLVGSLRTPGRVCFGKVTHWHWVWFSGAMGPTPDHHVLTCNLGRKFGSCFGLSRGPVAPRVLVRFPLPHSNACLRSHQVPRQALLENPSAPRPFALPVLFVEDPEGGH